MGPVYEWKMTEEERLAYIAKYPIKPKEKPKGAEFSNVNTMAVKKKVERKKRPTIMDKVDKDDVHKRFSAGEKLTEISDALGINVNTLNAYIKEQRKLNLDEWPYREQRKKGDE
ncbi:hypothetical protein [Peribacillus loiseleuriae]|uniref:hypothetical protein n=1 Tax=Peribacillus loiseleuriae TaxID=1679170 RepID=UPI003D07638B